MSELPANPGPEAALPAPRPAPSEGASAPPPAVRPSAVGAPRTAEPASPTATRPATPRPEPAPPLDAPAAGGAPGPASTVAAAPSTAARHHDDVSSDGPDRDLTGPARSGAPRVASAPEEGGVPGDNATNAPGSRSRRGRGGRGRGGKGRGAAAAGEAPKGSDEPEPASAAELAGPPDGAGTAALPPVGRRAGTVPEGANDGTVPEGADDGPLTGAAPASGGGRSVGRGRAARNTRDQARAEADADEPDRAPAAASPRSAGRTSSAEAASGAGASGETPSGETDAERAPGDRAPGARAPDGPAGAGAPDRLAGAPADRGRTGARPPARDEAAAGADDARNPELPDRAIEGRPQSVEAAARALVPRKPQIGDTMPAPVVRTQPAGPSSAGGGGAGARGEQAGDGADDGRDGGKRRRRGTRGRGGTAKRGSGGATGGDVGTRPKPVEQVLYGDEPVEMDEKTLKRRKGRERKGRPVGRYLMCVHVSSKATQIAVLEGRSLVEHYVSRPSDDITEIHGNIYLAKVQNVLPGMEAAFVDIGTPKNAVLYRGDVHYDREDLESPGGGGGGGGNAARPRIEQVLRARQTILCQVTKNPIAHKGARLTQEVSLPGRFVVLIPNSSTYGISKRLPDNERRRLRAILDRVKPPQHGVIVRTAAEGVTTEEIERDVRRLIDQWDAIDALAKRSSAPTLLYREPDLALRVIREEFNAEYRGIVLDDRRLFEEVRSYVTAINPAWADRVEFYDPASEPLPLFERHHIHEQRLRALDKKVWLPSGGSLIIEHTEALTVIDVNTGKNVGSSSLEETVFRNNLEAAEEIARQLRLRDIGGIIVIDFVDMEHRGNRDEVIRAFRDALGRDKTRTQVFEISELGLVEMTRKRIGEGLIESVSCRCEHCEGRGLLLDEELVGENAP